MPRLVLVHGSVANRPRRGRRNGRSPSGTTFLRAFLASVGSPFDPPSPLPAEVEQGARTLLVERPPWEARIPLAELRALRLPTLVVSGAHSAAFDAVCDVLERELGAERAVCAGAGHVAQTTPGFNDVLERFVLRAEAA